MRILFAATGEIAIPVLERLHEMNLVKSVFTAPDAPGKRGKELIPSPVKVAAEKLGIPVSSPAHLGSVARIEASLSGCDTLVSFCYGKIFGPKFLSLFKNTYNIHPSHLPSYRGPSPLFETIINQDRECWITIQKIALECDSGDVCMRSSFPLDGTETLPSLEERVSKEAAAMAEAFFSDPSLYTPEVQKGEVTFSHMITKADGRIDFTQSAASIHARIRACAAWPKAEAEIDGEAVYLTGVSGSSFDIPSCLCAEEPGTVVSLDKKKGYAIATGDGYLYVNRLQRPARKEMDAVSFNNGNRNFISSVLS